MLSTLPRRERKAAERCNRINEKAPADLQTAVNTALQIGLSRKAIPPGESLAQIIARECPAIDTMAAQSGFTVNFDHAENSRQNLAQGWVFFTLVPIKATRLN